MSKIYSSEFPMGFDGAEIEVRMTSISTDSNGAGSVTVNFESGARNHQWSGDFRIGYSIEADSFCDIRYDEPETGSVSSPSSVDVYIQNGPAGATVNLRVTRFAEST